jgi:NAD(P)H dehydrogenase (quinone)
MGLSTLARVAYRWTRSEPSANDRCQFPKTCFLIVFLPQTGRGIRVDARTRTSLGDVSPGCVMPKIVIVVGHSRAGTFCDALGDAYLRGALAAGHQAQLYRTSDMDFDPILREAYVQVQPLEPDLQTVTAAIKRADHIVFVFPLWLGAMPAILKGFLERALQPDLVEPAKQGKFIKVLEGKSARIIVTMGMPGFVYRWWYGAYAVKTLKRNILEFMGVSPVRATILGGVEAVGATGRTRWLAEVEELGKSGG